MSKLTAMQELIEYLHKDFDWFVKNSPSYGVIPQIISKATEKLETERKHIIDAVNSTFDNTTFQKDGDGYMNCPFDGEQYYTQTFTQK